MDKPSHKYALILDEDLPCGVAINTAAHLAAQLGTIVTELGGGEVVDATGIVHAGIPVYPNVVVHATQEDLRSRLTYARRLAKEGLVILDYPEQGYTTSTDEAYRVEVARVDEINIRYFGFLVLGPRQKVNEVTKGLKLWTCAIAQPNE